MSAEETVEVRLFIEEMFDHGWGAYMDYAYPKDELEPLSCSGSPPPADRGVGQGGLGVWGQDRGYRLPFLPSPLQLTAVVASMNMRDCVCSASRVCSCARR